MAAVAWGFGVITDRSIAGSWPVRQCTDDDAGKGQLPADEEVASSGPGLATRPAEVQAWIRSHIPLYQRFGQA